MEKFVKEISTIQSCSGDTSDVATVWRGRSVRNCWKKPKIEPKTGTVTVTWSRSAEESYNDLCSSTSVLRFVNEEEPIPETLKETIDIEVSGMVGKYTSLSENFLDIDT